MIKLVLLASLALSAVTMASEYVVLRKGNPTLALNLTDIAVLVGTNRTGQAWDSEGVLNVTMPDVGREMAIDLRFAAIGTTVTGATKIRMGAESDPARVSDYTYAVFKVIKPGQELLSPPVVTPQAADARYDIILETSTDMNHWIPAAPGEYLGSASQRFFRVRAVVKPATP